MTASGKAKEYRVLARKYRPRNFDELIGQDALVRTLKNAITSGRIAHAFMLTGVRGVGKTTTARIIAKALNHKGPDGKAGPTIGPTDDCPLCQAITEDRHPDVMEMDAASHTGVDNMRDILDGVRYAPVEARYKIYIIDEVHMLSTSAFNALLKTLEEPPEHVKFIFATTEIRKVPVTVLSRCQRFDLRRVEFQTLCGHYKSICEKESITPEDSAIEMIARAADGSVRDGLSLLDQAIALSGDTLTGITVQEMLGLTDRMLTLDLLESALTGKLQESLNIMDDIYTKGGSPLVLIQDLLELVHLLTKYRAVPDLGKTSESISGHMLQRLQRLAGTLSMPTLGKSWQLLLKGIGEVQEAPNPQAAAEMLLIRLSYTADLPDPADLLRRLENTDPQDIKRLASESSRSEGHEYALRIETAPAEKKTEPPPPSPKNLRDIVDILEQRREALIAGEVYQYAHMIKLEKSRDGDAPLGHLELRLKPSASPKLAQNLTKALIEATGHRWIVTVSGKTGQPTLSEQRDIEIKKEIEEAGQNPLVQEVMKIFPGSKIIGIEKTAQAQDNAPPTNNDQQAKEKAG